MKTAGDRAGVVVTALLIAAALVGGALSGCVPEPPPTPSPVASSPPPTPLFASDAEALAAATAAYKAYLAVEDEILADGGKSAAKIEAVATGEAAASAESDYQEFISKGLATAGRTQFDSLSIQEMSGSGRSTMVRAYVCDDVSLLDVIDVNGVSVVSPDRVARTPFVVQFQTVDGHQLLLSQKDVWTGTDFC